MRFTEKYNLTDNPIIKIFTLCVLYVAQGIPFGYINFTLAAYLTKMFSDRGMDAKAISIELGSLMGYCALPWAFKWAWGPIIDGFSPRAFGRRRPWILFAQLMMAITMGVMVCLNDLATDIKILTTMAVIHNVFCALQDVAVDALAVDILKESERGKANGFMYASKYLGTFIGAAGLGYVAKFTGLRATLVIQVVMLLVIMILPLLLLERKGEKLFPWSKGKAMSSVDVTNTSFSDVIFSLLKAFSLRSAILTVLLGLLLYMGVGVLAVLGPILTIKVGWAPEEFTSFIGGYGTLVSLVASVLGGYLADLFSPKKVIGTGTIVLAVVWLVFGLTEPLWPNKPFLVTIMMVEAFLAGMITVAFFSLAMGVSWPKVAATQFTAYMACLNLATALASKLEPILIQHITMAQIYFAMAVVQLLAVVVLLMIDPGQTRRVLGDVEAEPAPELVAE
jgi:PAT family beta-lactamase induction signal transducer AmpG